MYDLLYFVKIFRCFFRSGDKVSVSGLADYAQNNHMLAAWK
jgi:hypothetical protein